MLVTQALQTLKQQHQALEQAQLALQTAYDALSLKHNQLHGLLVALVRFHDERRWRIGRGYGLPTTRALLAEDARHWTIVLEPPDPSERVRVTVEHALAVRVNKTQ